jgi:hypothetical protein
LSAHAQASGHCRYDHAGDLAIWVLHEELTDKNLSFLSLPVFLSPDFFEAGAM